MTPDGIVDPLDFLQGFEAVLGELIVDLSAAAPLRSGCAFMGAYIPVFHKSPQRGIDGSEFPVQSGASINKLIYSDPVGVFFQHPYRR